MQAILADLRLALRRARQEPAFSLLVIVTLGLGIGANTAVFSAVNGLLRPGPFTDPDRLVRISSVRGDQEGPLAVPELDALKALPVVEDAAMYTDQGMYNASGFGTPEELAATITNHNLFRLLGVEPMLGSTFSPASDRTRRFDLVISHGLWVRKFGRDPNVVGRTMTLDGAPGYVIHGVMPPDFTFPTQSDLFRSSGIAADPKFYERRDVRGMMAVARLRDGVTIRQARDAIDALGRRLAQEFPATNGGLTFRVAPLSEMYTGTIRPYVLLLFGAVGLVLVIACANVANLFLSRALARDREVALRIALGAERRHIIRQLLVESLMLSAAGALLGLTVAFQGVRVLTAMVPVQLPHWMRVEVDGRVALFLIGVTLVTGTAAGLVPALRTWSTDLQATLKEITRGASAGVRQQRLRHGLVIVDVALALVLLVGAALMLQTVARLQRVPLGFDADRALTFRVELGWAAYGTLPKTVAFHRRVIEAMRALPGVRAVSFDDNLPMSGKPRDAGPIRLFAQSPDDEARNPFVNRHVTGPDYFTVMGIALRGGRAFSDGDRPETTPVAVVSRRAADRLWPSQDPIGRRFQFADTSRPDTWLTVVGLSDPVLHHELDGDPGLDIYLPYTQSAANGPYYVLKTSGDPLALAKVAPAIIGQTDANQSFLDVQSYDGRIARRMWQRHLSGVLFGSFSVLALLLSSVGLYGVLSQLVTQQTRDIAVRVALGATRADILRMIIGRGLTLAAIGAGIGLVLASLLARGVADVLFGISPHDPVTFAGVTLLLLVIAALACYVPARRAMAIAPLEALRTE